MRVAIPWQRGGTPRIDRAQSMLARKLLSDGNYLEIFPSDPRPYLNEVLVATRKAAGADRFFAFSNSDVTPFMRFNDLAMPGKVVGLSRVESNGVCLHAVDAYIFDCAVWDKLYAPDTPRMFVGAHATDWWVARTAFAHGAYVERCALRHESHPRSSTSKGEDELGKAGFKEWLAYAKRHNLPPGNIEGLKKNSVE